MAIPHCKQSQMAFFDDILYLRQKVEVDRVGRHVEILYKILNDKDYLL